MIVLSKSEIHFKVPPPYSYERVVLRVWKDRLNALVNPDATTVIYMRLDSPNFSVPFDKKCRHYAGTSKWLDKLLELGEFAFDLKHEKDILDILSHLKLKE